MTPDPTARFTDRVADYVRARPTYPREVLDVLAREVGFDATWRVADVGAGTGISARLFLDHGNAVVAVEPNAAMREAMDRDVGGRANFRAVDGTAEATGLAGASVDLVTAAQAFHWFDVAGFRAECRRVLRPGGVALLVWNDRRTGGSPFAEAYESLLMRWGTDYASVNHRRIGDAQFAAFFGGPYRSATLANAQDLDLAGLTARLLSSSYVPGPDDPRRGPMLDDLRGLFDAANVGGAVTIAYDVQMFYGPVA